MNICLTNISALQFWRSTFACKLAGKPAPFWEADTPDRPILSFPTTLQNEFEMTGKTIFLSKKKIERISFKKQETSKLSPYEITLPLHVITSQEMVPGKRKGLCYHTGQQFFRTIEPTCGLRVISPEGCFISLASSLDLIDLVLIGYEFCGYYALANNNSGYSTRKQLTSKERLRKAIVNHGSFHGVQRARKAICIIENGSNSPMETVNAILMFAPHKLGGANLKHAQLNANITLPTTSFRAKPSIRTCDFLWKNGNVDLEYIGFEPHSTKAQQTKDSKRFREMEEIGIDCIEITHDTMMDIAEMNAIYKRIAGKTGQKFKPRCADFHARQFDLFSKLVPGFAEFNARYDSTKFDFTKFDSRIF